MSVDQRNIVRTAITQATWTGDQESMIQKHEEFVRTAAKDGVQVICFQELFHGPYFGIVQDSKYYEYAHPLPGPLVERFQKLAAEYKMVIVLPIYEEEQPGVLYNTCLLY